MKVAAPSRDPNKFAPVFVLAPARTYSSVISMMVGQHPELIGLPELKLFAYATIGELEDSLPSFWIERGVTHRSPGLVRALAQFVYGSQTSEALSLARGWLRARDGWSGADVFDFLMDCASPRVCVEKSPENVETSAALERLTAAYPRARYLHLTRHPVTTQRSIQQHLERILPGYGAEDQPMSGFAQWYETHRRILRLASTLPDDRYMRVKAEDVLNDMRSQLRGCAEWLGLRTDSEAIEAMTHPEASPFACLGASDSGVTGGNDPAFLLDPIPRKVEVPRTMEKPADWIAEAGAWQRVVDLARYLGYP